MKKFVLLLSLFCLTGCGGLNCPKDYDLDGDICKKEIDKTSSYSDNTCPSEYEYKDGMCYKYAKIEIK